MKLTIEAPSIAESRGGLLSVIDVITDADPHYFREGVQYVADRNAKLALVPAPGTDKKFDVLGDIISGAPFSIYKGVKSQMLFVDNSPKAADVFGAGESNALETVLQSTLLNTAAVDLTPVPGTAVASARTAVGILEQYAAEKYDGLPVLHANRLGASLLRDVETDKSKWTLSTRQGTPIINGGGYGNIGPGAVAAKDGEAWLYISGQVHIWRSSIELVSANALAENRNLALAEATYVAVVETFVAAILVKE